MLSGSASLPLSAFASEATAGSEAPATEEAPKLTAVVEAAGAAMFLLGNICERESDVVSCQQGLALVAAGLSARALLSPAWQLGGRFDVGFEPANRGTGTQVGSGPIITTELSRRLYRFAVTGRYQPVAVDGFWLGASVGAVHLQELAKSQGTTRIEASSWAPALDGQVGYDFLLGENVALSLGLELNALLFSGNTDGIPEDGRTSYGNVFGGALSFGVNVRF